MLSSDINIYNTPAPWWEAECVKYGLSYTPVRSRLMKLMGSHIVELTNRKYMTQLARKLQEDYEAQQRIRIERRKLKPTLAIPELYTTLSISLTKTTTRKRDPCTSKFHDVNTARKCKQLSRRLFANDLVIRKNE